MIINYFELCSSEIPKDMNVLEYISKFADGCRDKGIAVLKTDSQEHNEIFDYLTFNVSDFYDLFNKSSDLYSDVSELVADKLENVVFILTEKVGDVKRGGANAFISAKDSDNLYGVKIFIPEAGDKIIVPQISEYCDFSVGDDVSDFLISRTSDDIDGLPFDVSEVSEDFFFPMGAVNADSKEEKINDWVRLYGRHLFVPTTFGVFYSCVSQNALLTYLLSVLTLSYLYGKRTKIADVELENKIKDANMGKLFEASYPQETYDDISVKDFTSLAAQGLGDFFSKDLSYDGVKSLFNYIFKRKSRKQEEF